MVHEGKLQPPAQPFLSIQAQDFIEELLLIR